MTTAEQKEILYKEKLKREQIKRHKPQRESLYEFMKYYWLKERKEPLVENRHIKEICNKLEGVYNWDIKRLIINIPPRSLKTELVSKAFPVWCLWHKPNIKFMEISYSATLAETNSLWARNMYNSQTYRMVFPDRVDIKDDQNTKQRWETKEWWQYYASWSDGTITGIGADIIIIDDPLKPDDANSDLMRTKINNNYHDTLYSRLNDKKDWAIVIIMQRLHDDDLCWHLLESMRNGTWDEWETLVIPAIAEADDEYRKKWESFFESRFPIDFLNQMRTSPETKQTFSTQYQQNPVNKDTQEFHEEWFRYYNDIPEKWRIFTACDPAFSKKQSADYTAIVTAKFDWMDMYILEITQAKLDPAELIDKLIYHKTKRDPEKIGIESFQAQQMIWFNLKLELEKRWMYANIEEIKQTWDKETKIRKLIPLYRSWHIYHKLWMYELEKELTRFPKWAHDDIIDATQMLYNMYELTPNTNFKRANIKIEYDNLWRPIMVNQSDNDRL